MKAKKFNMKGLDKKVRTALETSLILIGNEAKNQFTDNFKKQGFEDKAVEPWKPRKKGEKRAGRAILVKSGDLRRSIHVGRINKSALSIRIMTDLKYASVHNFGERAGRGNGFKMPKRKFIGDSFKLNEKVKRIVVKKLDSVFKK